MLVWIAREASKLEEGSGLHVTCSTLFLTSFNLLGNLMLLRDMFEPESNEGSKIFMTMMGLREWLAHADVVDLFPWLRWLDPQRLQRNKERDMGKNLEIAFKKPSWLVQRLRACSIIEWALTELLCNPKTLSKARAELKEVVGDAQVLVNAWAIGREPDAWEDPLAFKPERFLGSKI
ncbi:cytochrome P450 76A2-like [Prosopis cineraria]|uniref:cytochrome P450 76A2-like n=1 Tax=Prosopis cineraria TaxID=364024 RepID=UPI00240FF23C|nr:cytochrome P450 76A2-like [Prosopis cineraria]